MAILPESLTTTETETEPTVEIEPSKTYKLDYKNGTIGGFIDGKEAVRQFVLKAIRTARNRFLIYDEDYGSDIEGLIGADLTEELIEVELPRIIEEAIANDDRIDSITNFEKRKENDKGFVSFTVVMADGTTFNEEVSV